MYIYIEREREREREVWRGQRKKEREIDRQICPGWIHTDRSLV